MCHGISSLVFREASKFYGFFWQQTDAGAFDRPLRLTSWRRARGTYRTRSPRIALLPLFWGEGFPTKIDYIFKMGTLTSLLEDLEEETWRQ